MAVRSESLRRALNFKKENNRFYENVEINMKNIGAHPLHINKISDGDKSNISEDLSDSKEKRTVSLKDDRSGVSGDDAVMIESLVMRKKKLMTHKMNTGYLLMKHAWNHMYQTI